MNHIPPYQQILDILERQGWTKETIATSLSVSTRTVYRWQTTASAATYLARRLLYIEHIKGTPHDPDNT